MVDGMALLGNHYDGHTLCAALEQVRRMTGQEIEEAFVDRGYRGHGETQTMVYISSQLRGIKSQRLKCSLKRRQAIEPVIGHLKSDGLLRRNYLQGTQHDQVNVLLSCAGHNLHLILANSEFFGCKYGELLTLLVPASRHGEFKNWEASIVGTAWQPALISG